MQWLLVFWPAFGGATLETCPGPLPIPLSLFGGGCSLYKGTGFAATLAPGTGPLITPISTQSLSKRGSPKALMMWLYQLKETSAWKKIITPPLLPQTALCLCCWAFLFIIIIIPQERTYDIISVIQRATASIYISLFMQPPCAVGAMHWSITKLAWKDIPPFKSSRGHFT